MQALLRLSRHADALAAANTALEVMTALADAPTDLLAKAHYRRGVALQELQKLPEALAALIASHEAMPTPETLAVITKLRAQVVQAGQSAAAEEERTPWGAAAAPATVPALPQQSDRNSGNSDASFVHVGRGGGAGGGTAPDCSAGGHTTETSDSAPAGALRPSRDTLSGDGSTGGDDVAVAMVAASDLESTSCGDSGTGIRQFHVPIQEPPASAQRPVAAMDSPGAAGGGRVPGARADTARGMPGATAAGTGGGGSAEGPKKAAKETPLAAARPESPQELAQRALRSAHVHVGGGVVGGTGGGGSSGSDEVLPIPPLPVTAHEFLQAIGSLRRAGASGAAGPAQAAVRAYVRSIPPADYPKIIKSNLDGRVLSEFAAVMKAAVPGGQAWCKACLMGLVGVERFEIVMVMLPASEKKVLVDVKAQLELTTEEAAALAKIR